MTVNRDNDQRSRAGAERLNDSWGDDNSSGIAGRNDLSSEFHVRVSMGFRYHYQCLLR